MVASAPQLGRQTRITAAEFEQVVIDQARADAQIRNWPENLGRWPRLFGEGLLERSAARFSPAMDVVENDQAYVVTVEVPGGKKDDVSVELHDNVLTLRGEKRNEREEKKERSHWVERSYGAFSRSFTLPRDANADRVEASFQDGVLTVTIPKTEEKKPKRIAVKS